MPYFFQETKTYNSLYQRTKQTTTGTGGTAAEIEYNFAATTNNGRITSRKNNVLGEEVVYAYDELNRLISASTAGSGGWGQSFGYDGFGNLLNQTPTNGTAPSISLSVDGATNRVNSSGWGYDANGNTTLMPIVGGSTANAFDVDNRMVSSMGGAEEYGYAPDNKRVWKKEPGGTETVYFYGANGQKLVTYTVQASPFALIQGRVNVYFGGKLIRADGVAVVHDRLGSVVARATCAACPVPGVTKKDYFPYGDEIGGGTTGNVDKFGTYHRDGTTGLDYADQRYFAGMSGRFLTSDSYEASGGVAEPSSWNRVSYVGGDPVNKVDPSGQYWEWMDSFVNFEVGISTSGGWAGGVGGRWWGCQATGFTGASFCGLQYDLSGAILAVMPPPARSKVGRECRQALYYQGVQTLGGLLDTANHSILALEYRDEYDDGSYISGFASATIEGTSSLTWWVNPSTAVIGMPVTVGLSLVITLDASIGSPEQGGYFAGANTPGTGTNCATNAGMASNAAALRDGPDILYFGAFTNSNSLISTLLANAGVSLAAPPNTPGWGNPLLYAPAGSIRLYRWP